MKQIFQKKNPPPGAPRWILPCIISISIFFYILIIPELSRANNPPKLIIFKPIQARATDDPRTSWGDTMRKAGITDAVLGLGEGSVSGLKHALATFQTDPDMATAIGVLKYYKTISDKLSDKQRQALFANDKDVFGSLMQAKYELALQTSRALGRGGQLDHALRVGSSGEDLQKWMKWVPGMDPPLNPAIHFKSDDDVTHVATRGSLAKNHMAAEDINGSNANVVFKKISRDFGYKEGLDHSQVMTDFLSPLKTFLVLKQIGRIDIDLAGVLGRTRLQAYVNSNEEKYTGLFAEEFLCRAAEQKGIVIADVNNPVASVKDYRSFTDSPEGGNRSLPKFLDVDDLHVWVANNQRMIIEVHGKDLHTLAKYSLRMIAGYDALGIKSPDFPGFEKLRKAANAAYHPDPASNSEQIIREYGGEARIKSDLDKYCRKMVQDSNRQHMEKFTARLHQLKPKDDSDAEMEKFLQSVKNDPELEKIKANLALAYSNIDQTLRDELISETRKIVTEGDPAQTTESKKIMQGLIAGELEKCIKAASVKGAEIKEISESFRRMRKDIGTLIDQELHSKKNITLDTLLLQAAQEDSYYNVKGKNGKGLVNLTVEEWHFVNGRLVRAKVSKPIPDIEHDLRFLKGMGSFFGWNQEKMVKKTLEYFSGHVSEALGYVQLLHKIMGPPKKTEIKYKDIDGKIIQKTIPPSTMQRGYSLGLLTFKLSLKGYSLYGDAKDGIKLFTNLHSMYGGKSAALTNTEILNLRAESLALFINLVDYNTIIETFGNIGTGRSWPIPTGLLSNLASLSDANPLDDAKKRDLTLSAIKDLCSIFLPELTVFFTLYDIGAWGYDKYMLSRAEDKIVTLLVENGDWDLDLIGTGKKNKHPELKRLCLSCPIGKMLPGDTDFTVLPGCLKWLSGENINRICKLPDAYVKDFSLPKNTGILTRKSKTFVHPREQVLEIAYRNNYIGSSSSLGLFAKVAKDFFVPTIGKINSWYTLNDPKTWTQKELKDTLSITYPDDIREDLTTFPRKSIKKIRAGKMASAWTVWVTPMGSIPWLVDPNQIVSENTRRMFAMFVADYWCKRQILLEGPVLDGIIEKASRKVYKNEVSGSDYDKYYEGYLDLLRRAKLIDDRVWKRIADAAIPMFDERHSVKALSVKNNTASGNVTNKDNFSKDKVTKDKVTKDKLLKLDPEPKYPIAKNFLQTNKPLLNQLIENVEWLDRDKEDTAGVNPPLVVYESDFRGETRQRALTKSEVENRAKEIMEKFCDKLFRYETTYDGIIQTMDQTNGYVNQGAGYALLPKYHVCLTVNKGPGWLNWDVDPGLAGDKSAVEEWQRGYRKALTKTESDVAQYLRDCKDKKGQSYVEELLRSWGGVYYGLHDEVAAARAHPYWPRLLRLRFQINKLDNIKKVIDLVSKTNFHNNVEGCFLLKNKILKVPENLLYSVSDSGKSLKMRVKPVGQDPYPENHVRQWIEKVQKKMEDEYEELIVGMTDMFIVKLELERLPTQGEMSVLTYLKATATIRQKKDPKAKPGSGNAPTGPKTNIQPLTGADTSAAQADNSIGSINPSGTANLFGQLSASQEEILNSTIKAQVHKYCWRIYDKDGRDIFVDEIPVGKSSQDKLDNPANWLFPLTEAGHFFLEFTLVGANNLTLGKKIISLKVSDAAIKGKIKIWGDWPEDPRSPDIGLFVKTCQPVNSGSSFRSQSDPDSPAVQLQAPQCKQWGSSEIYHIKVPSDRNQLLDIDEKIKKISIDSNTLRVMVEEQNIQNYLYGDFKVFSRWGYRIRKIEMGREILTGTVKEKQSKTPGEGIVEPELLAISDLPQFEMFVPYRELILVKVTDASGDKTKAQEIIILKNNVLAIQYDPSDSKFAQGAIVAFPSDSSDAVKFRAEALRKFAPKVHVYSPAVTFKPENKKIEFLMRLPFFNTKRLTVKGRFVAPPGLDPPLNISGGMVSSNLGFDTSVGTDGSFSFKNRKPWKQLDDFIIKALVWEGDAGRVFHPVGGEVRGGFKKAILAHEFDMGDIDLEQHTVAVKRIPVVITDWEGRALSGDKLKVMIGDRPARWDGSQKQFIGSWTFTKRHETVAIKAVLAMDYGLPVKGETELEIKDTDFLAGEVKITSPLKIKLEIYSPFLFRLSNSIKVPRDQPKPSRVKLVMAEIENFKPVLNKYEVAADATEMVRVNAPVRLGKTLTLKVQAPPVKSRYQGSGSVVVPRKPGCPEMNIILTDKKTSSSAITINNLAVAGAGGVAKPVMGKGMTGTAVIAVGETESPQLSLSWLRKSDKAGAGDLQIISVKNHTRYPVSRTFGPVPKNLRSKYDTLCLTVSDAAVPPQEDKAELDFEWEIKDEFHSLTLPMKATQGDKIEISSSWTIADGAGSEREISYSANGFQSPVEVVTVVAGRRFHHSYVLDTDKIKAGKVLIKAEISNFDPHMSTTGQKYITLKKAKDQILRVAALGANNQSEAIESGDEVNIFSQIFARGEDGVRRLVVSFHGQKMERSLDLKKEQKIYQTFTFKTGQLRPSRYFANVKLYGVEGKLMDSKVIHFLVQKKKDPNDSGLQDVYCDSPSINIKFWDHATQDGDIVTIKIGKDWEKTVNLNACGGPKEPFGGGCVFYNLKLGKGKIATISVTAVNEGSISPNTASLKIDGGCTPSLQHWNLSTGGSGRITIHRGKPPVKRRR